MTFVWKRIEPIEIMILKLKRPLVEVGGKSLRDLREDFYDNSHNISGRHPKNGGSQIVSVYDIVLSGGEPYAVWR